MGFNVIGMTNESYKGLMVLKHKKNLHVLTSKLNHFNGVVRILF